MDRPLRLAFGQLGFQGVRLQQRGVVLRRKNREASLGGKPPCRGERTAQAEIATDGIARRIAAEECQGRNHPRAAGVFAEEFVQRTALKKPHYKATMNPSKLSACLAALLLFPAFFSSCSKKPVEAAT